MIPFAVANAPADTKFLACVTGDKIVLAICDVAFEQQGIYAPFNSYANGVKYSN